MIYAIGDIHGMYKPMMELMAKINPKPEDEVVFMGDYIDRGPDSFKVVDQLIKWKKENPHWTFLYGNHEDIFRDFITGGAHYGMSCWFANGGKTTMESYGGHFGKIVDGEWIAPRNPEFPREHLDFLFKETVYLYETEKYAFVHAGLVPGLFHIKANENHPDTLIWAREGFIESPFVWEKKVIFGHTADFRGQYYVPKYKGDIKRRLQPIVMANKIGIDTASCPPAQYKLTAVELPTERFIQVKS